MTRIEGCEKPANTTTSNTTKLIKNNPSLLLNTLIRFCASKSNKVVLYYRILCLNILDNLSWRATAYGITPPEALGTIGAYHLLYYL
jgi:hypothetical protein